jgi:hypothetical protein
MSATPQATVQASRQRGSDSATIPTLRPGDESHSSPPASFVIVNVNFVCRHLCNIHHSRKRTDSRFFDSMSILMQGSFLA